MEKLDKLKKCPYCDGDASIVHSFENEYPEYYVECSKCHIRTVSDKDSIKNVIELWNSQLESNLKPCPFCGSNDIKYSIKTTGGYKKQYHLTCYCNKCHCYGPRVLVTLDNTSKKNIRKDLDLRQQAIDVWNKRV